MRGADIEIALDRGAVVAGERSLPVCELEAELKRGDIAALVDFGHDTIDAHGMWLGDDRQGDARRTDSAHPGEPRAVKAKPARLRGAASGEEIFRAIMRSCLDQVLANAQRARRGRDRRRGRASAADACRRMRTAWRELAAWRGSLAPGWEDAGDRVFGALGDYRDRSTVAASMQQQLADAGSPGSCVQPPGPSVDPGAVVRAPRFQHALLDALAFLTDASPGGAAVAESGPGEQASGLPRHTIEASTSPSCTHA